MELEKRIQIGLRSIAKTDGRIPRVVLMRLLRELGVLEKDMHYLDARFCHSGSADAECFISFLYGTDMDRHGDCSQHGTDMDRQSEKAVRPGTDMEIAFNKEICTSRRDGCRFLFEAKPTEGFSPIIHESPSRNTAVCDAGDYWLYLGGGSINGAISKILEKAQGLKFNTIIHEKKNPMHMEYLELHKAVLKASREGGGRLVAASEIEGASELLLTAKLEACFGIVGEDTGPREELQAIVSDAHIGKFNGAYFPIEQHLYRNEHGCHIYFQDGQWRLTQDSNTRIADYMIDSIGSAPPSGAWRSADSNSDCIVTMEALFAGSTGSVFIDVFGSESRPSHARNVAMLYVVGPKGEGGKAGHGPVLDKDGFLKAVHRLGERALRAVADYNEIQKRAPSAESLPLIEEVRWCLVSGGVYKHSEVSKVQVARETILGMQEVNCPQVVVTFTFDGDVFRSAFRALEELHC